MIELASSVKSFSTDDIIGLGEKGKNYDNKMR